MRFLIVRARSVIRRMSSSWASGDKGRSIYLCRPGGGDRQDSRPRSRRERDQRRANGVTTVYAERAQTLLLDPPEHGDGIWTAKSK